jgi:hypothetical protein
LLELINRVVARVVAVFCADAALNCRVNSSVAVAAEFLAVEYGKCLA